MVLSSIALESSSGSPTLLEEASSDGEGTVTEELLVDVVEEGDGLAAACVGAAWYWGLVDAAAWIGAWAAVEAAWVAPAALTTDCMDPCCADTLLWGMMP